MKKKIDGANTYVYIYDIFNQLIEVKKNNVTICYELNPVVNFFNTTVDGGCFPKTGILNLTMFYDGIENFDRILRNSFWEYDTEEQLLGVLEKQADLFEDFVFDWVLGKKYTNFDAYTIKSKIASERGKLWENAPNEEKIKTEEWRSTRFYPKKWKLE